MDEGSRELEFLGRLGQGGFGTVYLANLRGRDRFQRRVAVKVLHTSADDPELVGRQRDEARLLGLLSHPAIVQVLDLTEVQGRPAVVMEYVEGVDLGAVVRSMRARGESVPVRAALDVVATAASGLDAAYNATAPGSTRPLRAIHRDIKPANLLLTPQGAVKLLDFGIARADMEREGATGSAFFGTAAYMAPEFYLQEPVGPAYDVYALGVTLLEMLTTIHPERPVLEATRYAAIREAQLARVDPEVAALVRDMVAFRAEDRPSAALVQERAETLAARAAGDPASRFARRVVPDLAAARTTSLSGDELPTRMGVGRLDAGTPTPEAPPAPAPWWYRRRRTTLAVVAGLAVVATAVLAAAWLVGNGRDPAPLADASPPPVDVPAPAAPAPAAAAPSAPVAPSTPPAVDPPPAEVAVAAAPPPSGRRATDRGAAPTPAAPAADPPPPSTDPPPPAPGPTPSVAPTPAPTVAAVAARRLSIRSEPPGAAVTVDGAARGLTPVDGVYLVDGPHTVRLSLDGVTVDRHLDVDADLAAALTYSFTTGRWRQVY